MRLKVSDTIEETAEAVWRLRAGAGRLLSLFGARTAGTRLAGAEAVPQDPFMRRIPFARPRAVPPAGPSAGAESGRARPAFRVPSVPAPADGTA